MECESTVLLHSEKMGILEAKLLESFSAWDRYPLCINSCAEAWKKREHADWGGRGGGGMSWCQQRWQVLPGQG